MVTWLSSNSKTRLLNSLTTNRCVNKELDISNPVILYQLRWNIWINQIMRWSSSTRDRCKDLGSTMLKKKRKCRWKLISSKGSISFQARHLIHHSMRWATVLAVMDNKLIKNTWIAQVWNIAYSWTNKWTRWDKRLNRSNKRKESLRNH